MRARSTWDRAKADATKPGHTPARRLPPRLDGARNVTSPAHRSSLWSSHMHVNKHTKGATPASPMPTFRQRRARARTRATLTGKRTTLLETPRQPRPCQRFGTDGPAHVEGSLICKSMSPVLTDQVSFVQRRTDATPGAPSSRVLICGHITTSPETPSRDHANVLAQTGPRSYKSHYFASVRYPC